MGKNKKQNDTPIELAVPLLLAGLTLLDGDFKKAIKVFIITFIIVCTISFTFRYIIFKKRRLKLINSGIDIVDKMTGEEFEKFLLVHFEKLGYKVELTPTTNDYGADLILKKDKEKIVVQAKRWASKVGIEAVQQIIGAKEYYRADKCIVATNNFFTPNACNLAKSSNVELLDRTKLLEIMSKSNGREIAKEATKHTDIENRVLCSKCGAKMILKNGKYGEFYGCSNFPKCRNIKNIEM